MAIDERRRLELADAVKRTLGDEAGLTLMEMLTPVGWADVATKQDLAAVRADIDRLRVDLTREIGGVRSDLTGEIGALRNEVDLKFDTLEHKVMGAFHKEMTAQTWRLLSGVTAMFGLFAIVARI
ncbi:MAG: hypothetical protein ACHQIG_09495 [Acidimicrobiia bacterium]